jgi:hypothetical protein
MIRSGYTQRNFIIVAVIAALVSTLLLAVPVDAATFEEIVIMSDAGIPAEVIIEVIEATGLDDVLDDEGLSYLLDAELDPVLLEYVLSFHPDYSTEYVVDNEDNEIEDTSSHPNRAGGSGFHHSSTGYNPLNYRSDPNVYWEGPQYSQPYYGNYYPDGYYPGNLGVTVYQPPVYIRNSYPYGGGYYPRYYNNNRGYWNNGRYVIYDHNYSHRHRYYGDNWYNPYNDYYWRNGWYGSFGGSWHHGRGRSNWDSWGNAYYRNDGISLRISF